MRLELQPPTGKARKQSLIGQLAVVLVGVQIMFFGSFVSLNLPTATQRNLMAYLHNEQMEAYCMLPYKWREKLAERFGYLEGTAKDVRESLYVPLIPLAIFLGYVLGASLGTVAVALYLVLGLFAPATGIYPLACGGGLDYYNQPGFGYLLGAIAAAWCAGRATAKRRTSFRQSLAVLSGLLSAHLAGLTYLFGACLISLVSDGAHHFPQWRPWVFEQARNLTWYSLPYDVLFSFLLIGLGFPCRWLVKTLTAPDIAKSKQAEALSSFELDLDPA